MNCSDWVSPALREKSSSASAKQFEDFHAFEASFAEEVEGWTTLEKIAQHFDLPGVQGHLKELKEEEGVEFPTEPFLPAKHLESALPYFSEYTVILGILSVIAQQTV